MTTKSHRSMLVAVLLAASAMGALTTSANAAPPPLTSSVATKLSDAQKAVAKKDIPAALAAIAAAKALGNKKPYDDYMIALVEVAIDAQNNDMAGATTAAQFAADSTAIPDADKGDALKNALLLSMNAKQFDKAITYAKKLEPTNPTDPTVITSISNAYYFGGDFTSAKAAAQKRIDAAVAAGKTPDRNALQILLSAQVGLKDEAGAEESLEKLVAYYNDPADWTQMIDVAFGTKGIRDLDAIWLGRLLFKTGTVSQSDATMIGSTASHLSYLGDAQTAKVKGGSVDPDPTPRAAEDKKSLPAQIALGKGPKGTGTYNAKLADALYGYDMYAEAEEAAKLAMEKGGNPDTSEAPMVLGQAQAAQGKYDEALASFGKVTGGGPATARVVRLWVAYVNIKKAPPAAPAAAAAAK